jgi:type II secretory pathway pseudopilin PulG
MGTAHRVGRIDPEAGFTLAEATVAVALVGMGVGGVVAALLSVMRPVAEQRASAVLTNTAQNILADLRAATAYGTTSLSGLAGRGLSLRIVEPRADGTNESIAVRETFADAGSGVAVTIECADPSGHAVAVSAPLVREAPEPGSVVTADPSLRYEPSTPPPQPTIPPGPWHSPGCGVHCWCHGPHCPPQQ